MRRTLLIVALSAGCGGDKDLAADTGETGDTDSTSDTTVRTTLGVFVDWIDDGATPADTDGDGLPDVGCEDRVTITIDDPLSEVTWQFGMAETGSPAGWYGEDCFEGYASYNHCHVIGPNATLDEVTDCDAASVVPGMTTLLDSAKDPYLTYYLQDQLGNCFAFGHDPSYYGPLNCIALL